MILVFGGTSEANIITKALLDNGRKLVLSTATDMGKEGIAGHIKDNPNLNIISGTLVLEKIIELLKSKKFKVVVDVTHPFAVQATANIREACEQTRTDYFRLERKPFETENNKLVHKTDSFEQAANSATHLGEKIFLTIGIKNIKPFVKAIEDIKTQLIVRVLANSESKQTCLSHDIENNNIIAEDGPFSFAQNKTHFKNFQADVVVSKDSGTVGGVEEKIKACEELNIPIVLINRPSVQDNCFFDIDPLIKKVGAYA